MKRLLILISALLFLTQSLYPAVREMRAFWISRWEYTSGTTSMQKQALREAINNAQAANFNAIVLQVRGAADALYQSSYEPWSRLLTGNLGQDPGWDPLQFAINYAHQRHIAVHAWINTFTLWNSNTPPPSNTSPQHLMITHPEWKVCDWNGVPMTADNGYIGVSPGIPQVREHVLNVAMEIVNNYEVDGIHLDYIRYPDGASENGYSHDPISVSRFNSPQGNPQNLGWADWQRDNVFRFIKAAYDSVLAVKPWVKVSAAVIGRYASGGWNGYNHVYQDAKKWAREGKIDLLFPMAYMSTAEGFNDVIFDWEFNFSHSRHVIAGIGAYRIGWSDVLSEIDFCRGNRVSGECFFSYEDLVPHFSELADGRYKQPAPFPGLWWKNNARPQQVQNLALQVLPAGDAALSWDPVPDVEAGNPVICYGIYKSEGDSVNSARRGDFYDLVFAGETAWFDPAFDPDVDNFYSVSAFSLYDIEGVLSEQLNSRPLTIAGTRSGPPAEFKLFDNYPDPFNASTTIAFELPQSGYARLEIYDATGRRVKSLIEKEMRAGRHEIRWNGNNELGAAVSSGLYFSRLEWKHGIKSDKLLIVK